LPAFGATVFFAAKLGDEAACAWLELETPMLAAGVIVGLLAAWACTALEGDTPEGR
jgi:pheromone shutdown protein TraB